MSSVKKKTVQTKNIPKNSSNKIKYSNYYILAGILILTIIVYAKSIPNDFISGWDDDQYVSNNHDITVLTLEGLKNLCTRFYVSCYLPLTMLSYALEYKFFGLNPIAFHIDNLILHLLNTILVYIFVKSLLNNKFSITGNPSSILSQRTRSTEYVALICSLLFAIHPMHVESVAWIAERKDLLYTFFYLASLIYYMKYIVKTQDPRPKTQNFNNLKYYFFTLLLFILSLLSKSMAVTLPVVLILLDYYLNNFKDKILTIKYWAEKLPFFILSLGFGILTFVSQKTNYDIDKNILNGNIVDRFFMLTYSVSFYIVKIFIPVNLSAIHPYPEKTGGFLPLVYYLSSLFLVVLLFLIVRIAKREAKKEFRISKTIIFGILFYLVTASVVLMIIPVGHALVSERYTYVPYLGFFIIIGSLQQYQISNIKIQNYRTYYLLILSAFCLLFSVLSFMRTELWKDENTLFTDVIEKHPNESIAYNFRGMAIAATGNFNGAMDDLNKSIELDPNYVDAYDNRGSLRLRVNDFRGAMEDFNKATSLNSNYEDAYLNRGMLEVRLNENQKAIEDFDKAISLKPEFAVAYNNRGQAKANIRDYNGALADYNMAISLNSTLELTFINRGCLKGDMKDFDGAIKDFDSAISLNPKEAKGFYGRGFIKSNLSDYRGALDDFNNAIVLNPNYAIAIFYRANIEMNLNNKIAACDDWNSALKLGFSEAKNNLEKYCK